MIILIVLLAALCLYRLRFARFHEDYMDREQSTSIKGVFAMLIVFSHMKGYLQLTAGGDLVYSNVLAMIGQLMVTMYFLYSGYGVLESYRRKKDYARGFFKNRLVKTLLHFDMAVVLFAVLNLLLSISYPAQEYIWCWIGWGSIGNSNWFIFDTLVLYAVTLLAMWLARKLGGSSAAVCGLVTVLSIVVWFLLYFSGKAGYWYDTFFCYGAGMWYSLLKERIDCFVKANGMNWWIGLTVIFGLFTGFYLSHSAVLYNLCTVFFALLVVWITMKVRVDNAVLRWLGVNSFAIYILQRLPMIVLQSLGVNRTPLLFAAAAIPVTLVLAWGFNRLLKVVDGKMFPAV